MSLLRSCILATGSALPRRIVSNDELATRVDTSDEWIVQRTGIRHRHIAGPDETAASLGTDAARKALERAGLTATDIDMVVVATTTPDHTFPATAAYIQNRLGMTGGIAFDVQAVCSGFLYALTVADNFLRLGQARRALVIGSEVFSRLLDWTDRGTCVLFGDGAGAVVLEARDGTGSVADRGILTSHLHSDGRFHDRLYVDGGVGATGTVGHVRMEGREVFKHAVVNLANAVEEALTATGLSAEDIDWLVPHQANQRIIEATARKLGMPLERVVVTVDHHANTSAASIPLALDEAASDGRLQLDQLVLLEAMGGGFTWGSVLVRW